MRDKDRQAILAAAAELRAIHSALHPECKDQGATTCPTWEVIHNLNSLVGENQTMKFVLAIECENDSFEDDPQETVAVMLRTVASDLHRHKYENGDTQLLFDPNGNRVGSWRFED